MIEIMEFSDGTKQTTDHILGLENDLPVLIAEIEKRKQENQPYPVKIIVKKEEEPEISGSDLYEKKKLIRQIKDVLKKFQNGGKLDACAEQIYQICKSESRGE